MEPRRESPSGAKGSHDATRVRLEAFVEDFGLAMEGAGLPRAASRLLAWLLVCTPGEQSAEDLRLALHSSAGGVSQSLRLLTQLKFVERVGKRGDRRSYYRVAPNAWDSVMITQHQEVQRMVAVTQGGIDVLEGGGRSDSRRLREMHEFYAFLDVELPKMLDRFHAQQAERAE